MNSFESYFDVDHREQAKRKHRGQDAGGGSISHKNILRKNLYTSLSYHKIVTVL